MASNENGNGSSQTIEDVAAKKRGPSVHVRLTDEQDAKLLELQNSMALFDKKALAEACFRLGFAELTANPKAALTKLL